MILLQCRGRRQLVRVVLQAARAHSTITSSWKDAVERVQVSMSGAVKRSGRELPQLGPASIQPRRSLSTQTMPGRVVPFMLADIGEGIAEVEMMQWFVEEGDRVKQFDRICEVQSDKATVEISSRYDGVIKTVHHNVGSIVKVGSALVDIEVGDAASTGPTINNVDPLPFAGPASAPPATASPAKDMTPLQGGNEVILTTPAVRRVAKENSVDLSSVRGTGPEGRILKGDVLEFVKNRSASFIDGLRSPLSQPINGHASPQHISPAFPPVATIPPPSPSGVPNMVTSPPQPTPAYSTPPPSQAAESQTVPLRGVRRQMVRTMNASLKIPHFAYFDDLQVDKMAELRNALKPVAEAQGIKLSYLPFIVKAVSLAMLHYPVLNSSLSADETQLTYHVDHNIGVAMDTPKGLLVPVLRRAQSKSILDIAHELTELQRCAASGGFTEDHLSGATISLSNIGTIGGTYAHPKIVPPQVAIAALGKIQTLPRFADDGTSVVPVKLMNVSWSGDHRVLDGATMARFSNVWKAYLENPATMLAQLK